MTTPIGPPAGISPVETAGHSSSPTLPAVGVPAETRPVEPTTEAGRRTIADFESYVRSVPTDGDFAVGGMLNALRRDRQSSLDQIRGAVLAIEAEATATLREAAAPAYGLPGDLGMEHGVMRRCLLCGRTSRIVATPDMATINHEPDCALAAGFHL